MKKPFIFLTSLALIMFPMLLVRPDMARGQGPPPTLSYKSGKGVAAQQQAQNVELVGQIGGIVYGVALQGNYAYVGVWPRLVILDISDPAHPVVVGQTDVLPGVVKGVAVVGNYAYLANGHDGLHIINVSDPAHPTEVGFYPAGCWSCEEVAVSGNYVYAAAGGGGRLRVIDVSNPAAPTEIAFIMGYSEGVAVAGNYAYITGAYGMSIYNVANPTAPTEVGYWGLLAAVTRGVAVAGDYAYVANDESGLGIADVSNPWHPTGVSFYDTPGCAYDVAVAGNYAYVADGDGGLRIIDVSDPAHPSEAGFYDTPTYALGVAVSGHYAYVADADGGLVILRFVPPPASASIHITGGSLSSPADNTTYTFPSGTFTSTVVITHTALYPGSLPSAGDLVGIDHAFEVTAVYSDTGQPAQPTTGKTYTVTVQYTDAEKGPAIESTLALYYWDGSDWVKEPTSVVDTVNNTVTATPDHFSRWAVLGETRRVYLPLVLKHYPAQ